MDSKIDKRKNAEPYHRGEKPSARSEYFGKSYGQLQRESKYAKSKAKALHKAKNMKEGHNIIGGGKITNRLYPGGFKYKD